MIYSSIFTVTTAAADYSLVDIAAVKDELGITDSLSDARLSRWIAEVGAAIQGPKGIQRVMRAETCTETFRARAYQPDAWGEHFYPRQGGEWHEPELVPGLRLRRYPIVSVASIVVDGIALDPALDFEIDAEAGLIYRLADVARVAWYGQVVVVVYVGGYVALTDVPAELGTACLLMIKHRRAAQTRDPMLKQITIPGVSEKQFWIGATGDNGALPPEVEGLICGYRDVHI